MPGPGFEPTQGWEMYDLWAVVTLHHTSLCEPLNVQLQHSNSGDRRLFPSKRQKGLRGFLSSVSTWSILTEPGHQSELNVKTVIFFPCAFSLPIRHSSTKTLTWPCHSGAVFLFAFFLFSSRFKQMLESWLDFPLDFFFLRQSTSVGIKQVIGTSPGPAWWSRSTCQYPQLPRSPPPLPKNSTLTRTS